MPTHELDSFDQTPDERDQYYRLRCRHIFTAGHRCGSPCLRGEQFCYYHHTTRRPIASKTRANNDFVYNLPNPEDRDSIRVAVGHVMQAIARNNIDMKRAGMILYSLQVALNTFPPQPRPAPVKASNPLPVHDLIEDPVVDEEHGLIASIAEIEEERDEEDEYEDDEPAPRRSLARQLLDDVEEYEARKAAEAEQEAIKKAAFEEGKAAGMKLAEEVYGSVLEKKCLEKYDRECNTPAHWRAAEQLFHDSDPSNPNYPHEDDTISDLKASASTFNEPAKKLHSQPTRCRTCVPSFQHGKRVILSEADHGPIVIRAVEGSACRFYRTSIQTTRPRTTNTQTGTGFTASKHVGIKILTERRLFHP